MPEKIDLYINEANDYARDIGAPTWHPHVSVVHYDEVGEIRHTLNRYNVYGLFLQREFPENLTYGIGRYHEVSGSLLALSPGQIGGKPDDGTRRQYSGWVLLFDAQFIQGSEIERKLADYHFFSYNTNEALFLTEEEKDVLAGLMANLYKEIQADDSQYNGQDDIIRDYILLILDYCRRFYTRQFKEMTTAGGDIVREALGESPKDYIRGFIMMRAKNLLLSGIGVTQVSEQLGFEYPNHFTRFFKQMTGKTPSRFFAEQQQK